MPALLRNKKVLFWFKLAVSLGLFVYLLGMIDWARAAMLIGQADKFMLLLGPFCLLVGLVIASFRWQLTLTDSGIKFPYGQAFKGYLLGIFYGIFLPGVIGGDVIRIGLCAKQTKCQLGTATASVFLERLAGVFALLSFILLAFLFFPATLSTWLAFGSTSSITMPSLIGVTAMVIGLSGRRIWVNWLPQQSEQWLWRFARSGLQMLASVKTPTLIGVLVLSALYQSADIVVTFLFSQAMGLSVPLTAYFVVVPLVYLATVLPISLGGLGVREGTLVFLLAQFGVVTSDAVTLSFLLYLNYVVIGGLGGLVQLIETLARPKTDERTLIEVHPVASPNQMGRN